MISRANRFHGHAAVSRVRGDVAHSRLLSLRYAKSNRDDYRLAVVVSKKVAASAVTRNRIRRRIFELVRTQARVRGLPLDLIIYVKSSEVATLDSVLLASEVLELTKKSLSKL